MGKEVADKKASTKKIYQKTQPIRYISIQDFIRN